MTANFTFQGVNEDVDAGTEDVCDVGGVYAGLPALPAQAAEAINIVSSSANDAAAGTGARTIRVEGLDSTGKYAQETFTLNGTTPVVSASTWKRVFRAFGLTAGSGGVNAGAITIKHNVTTANVFTVIKAGRNQAALAAFTVPANKTARIEQWGGQVYRLSATAAGECVLQLMIRPTGANQAWRVLRQLVVPAVPSMKVVDNRGHAPIVLAELTDVKVQAVSLTADSFVSADIDVEW
jgi:hypothetical protein